MKINYIYELDLCFVNQFKRKVASKDVSFLLNVAYDLYEQDYKDGKREQ